MNLKSTSDKYGTVSTFVHWTSAILVIVLMTIGFTSKNSIDPSTKVALLKWHLPIAALLVVLTVFRSVWWIALDRRPKPIDGVPIWQRWTSQAVHGLFYLVILLLGISGIVLMSQSGAPDIIFNRAPEPLPDLTLYPSRLVHGVAGKFLFVLVTIHIFGALYHQFLRRDNILSRMGLGSPPQEQQASARRDTA